MADSRGVAAAFGVDAATTQQAAKVDFWVEMIGEAQDPSEVVAEYSKAKAQAGGNVHFERAYIARMVELGHPEMAETQARAETQQDVNNAMAWAVAAYMDGRRDRVQGALKEIARASGMLPENPFVQSTAAKLLAWHDTRLDRSRLPADVANAAAKVRQDLGNGPVFKAMYQQAKEAYGAGDGGGAGSASRPATGRTGARMADYGLEEWEWEAMRPVPSYAAGSTYNYYNYNTYPEPMAYGDMNAGYPWGRSWWNNSYWLDSWWTAVRFWWTPTPDEFFFARNAFFRNPIPVFIVRNEDHRNHDWSNGFSRMQTPRSVQGSARSAGVGPRMTQSSPRMMQNTPRRSVAAPRSGGMQGAGGTPRNTAAAGGRGR
ncbi:MAG: hypothetical protein ACM359_16595 [Bacillota bacterium]